jgi:hypothetical protein
MLRGLVDANEGGHYCLIHTINVASDFYCKDWPAHYSGGER